MTYPQSIFCIRIAAAGAFLAAVVTAIETWIGLAGGAVWANKVYFFDAGLLLILALGVLVRSRVAAGLLVLYWIASKALQFIGTNLFSHSYNWLIASVVLAVFAVGLIGTIFYHRKGLG